MDGDGPFSNPMRLINRLPLTTKKTAWGVMFQLSPPTGYTYKAIRSSNRNNPNGLAETQSETCQKENCNAKASVGNHRWTWTDRFGRIPTGRETRCGCPV